MFILKEIVCLNFIVTTKILDISKYRDSLMNRMYFYQSKSEEMFNDIQKGKILHDYWLMCAEASQDYYAKLISELSENEKRQLKMKDLPVPEFIKYEVVEFVKQLPFTENFTV